MANSVEDICNMAFRAAGLPIRIEEMYEGSDGAKVALELLGQARDELLDAKDWSFNRETAALTLLKGPPPNGGYNYAQPWNASLYPAPGFLYEYAYPANALDLRAIQTLPSLMPDLDPVPVAWRVDNDPTPNVSGNPPVATGPEAKVIYCNTGPAAIGVFRSKVTTPSIFDPGFTSALVALLGKRFAVSFGADVNTQREDMAEAVAIAQAQSDVRG